MGLAALGDEGFRLRRFALVAATVLALVLGAARADAAAAAEAPPTLSDAAKQELLLDVIERFIPHAEAFWRESDLKEPNSGYFEAAGSGVTQARGDGNMAIALATLLVARPGQDEYAGVPREAIHSQVVQVIRHEALTNKLSGAGYDRWGEGTWQASLETYNWAFAAKLLWADLDEETRELVKRVLTGEADILVTKPISSGEWGDTGAEDSGWNTPTPELAALMWPDDPRAESWLNIARKLAVNASSIAADASSDELIDGVPLRELNASVNLHPDLTLENHGYFNTIYQMVTHLLIGDAAIFAADEGKPIPEAFSFRAEDVYDQVLGPMVTGDGDIVGPAGQDWTSKDYQHLDFLTMMATRFDRADASVAESRALTQVAKRQALHADGAILGQPAVGYETMLIKRLTSAYWNHRLFGPSAQPSAAEYEAALARTAGVREYRDIELIDARQRDAFTSMSWDDARPMGLVVPGPNGHEDDPILAAYVPGSLIGSATGGGGAYSCDCREDLFSTAGMIGARGFSMTSFPDGVTLLLDRGEGSTFNLDFELIPGLTGERPVFSEAGVGLGDLPGNWWNVADRMGMVVLGGGGINARKVETANPYLQVLGSAATGSGNRGALVLPNADHETTARLAAKATQPQVPDGWSALLARAPDGSDRVAAARWGGPKATEIALSDERGAPLTSRVAALRGQEATARWSLEAPASRGETVRFFVSADAELSGRALGEDRAALTNDGDAPVHVEITWVGPEGPLSASRTIAAGEQVTARVVGGKLVTAGPEYELLLEASERMEALRSAVAGWRADGTIDRATAIRLSATIDSVLHDLGQALDADTAADPDIARVAAAVGAARLKLELLRAPQAPPLVRERLEADRRAVASLLEQAIAAGIGVTVRLEAPTAMPGQPLTVRVFLRNRSPLPVSDGDLSLRVPAGWQEAPQVAVDRLAPGESRTLELRTAAPSDATPGSTAELGATFRYRQLLRTVTAEGSVEVAVEPLLAVEAAATDLPLARGGWNEASFALTNNSQQPLEVTLAATAPEGIEATLAAPAVSIPAGSSGEVAVELRNGSLVSGSGELRFAAAAGAQQVAVSEALHFNDNLALNGLDAAWPAISASSAQGSQPPQLANDGNASTFWVAERSPSVENPAYLTVDHGAPVAIETVTMVPRVNYGPKAYAVEVSADGQSWQQIAEVPAAPNAANTTTLPEPVTARWLRLRITDSWDRVRPPRNVQVAELQERAP